MINRRPSPSPRIFVGLLKHSANERSYSLENFLKVCLGRMGPFLNEIYERGIKGFRGRAITVVAGNNRRGTNFQSITRFTLWYLVRNSGEIYRSSSKALFFVRRSPFPRIVPIVVPFQRQSRTETKEACRYRVGDITAGCREREREASSTITSYTTKTRKETNDVACLIIFI